MKFKMVQPKPAKKTFHIFNLDVMVLSRLTNLLIQVTNLAQQDGLRALGSEFKEVGSFSEGKRILLIVMGEEKILVWTMQMTVTRH